MSECPHFDGERYCGLIAAEVCSPALAGNRNPADPVTADAFKAFCAFLRRKHGIRLHGMQIWEQCWRYQRARAEAAEKTILRAWDCASGGKGYHDANDDGSCDCRELYRRLSAVCEILRPGVGAGMSESVAEQKARLARRAALAAAAALGITEEGDTDAR